MYKPVKLKTENQLNKILRLQKRNGTKVAVLFISLWDKLSQDLMDKVNTLEGTENLYIVDSYSMPHAFVIFKTTKVPHLVRLNKRSFRSEDHLSTIYRILGLGSRKV